LTTLKTRKISGAFCVPVTVPHGILQQAAGRAVGPINVPESRVTMRADKGEIADRELLKSRGSLTKWLEGGRAVPVHTLGMERSKIDESIHLLLLRTVSHSSCNFILLNSRQLVEIEVCAECMAQEAHPWCLPIE
jgi:hypothetical protein